MKKVLKSIMPLLLVGALASCNAQADDSDENLNQGSIKFEEYEDEIYQNSLDSSYCGESINLLDYVKNYATEPKLNVEESSKYKGFDTDKIYSNPNFNNYKYFKHKNNYYIDFLKNDPITSFVYNECLYTEGYFGLVGSEYGYYVSSKPIVKHGIKVTPIDGDSYNSLNTSVDDITVYKSIVTLIKYQMTYKQVDSNLEADFAPIILGELEMLAINNDTDYNDLKLERINSSVNSSIDNCFIHQKGWNFIPNLIAEDKSNSLDKDMERFSKLKEEGYNSILIPSIKNDYCLYNNSIMSYQEVDFKAYEDYTKMILDSFNKYGIYEDSIGINEITKIDFSKYYSYFTINDLENVYLFNGEKIYEVNIQALEGLSTSALIGSVPVGNFVYDGVEISYYDKKCIYEMKTNTSFFEKIKKDITSTYLEDYKEKAKTTLKHESEELGISINPSKSDIGELNQYLITKKIDEEYGFIYFDELIGTDDNLYTYYFDQKSSFDLMNNKDYKGIFSIGIANGYINGLTTLDCMRPVKLNFDYSCEFGQVKADGSIKPISVSYLTKKSTYILKTSLKEINENLEK